MLDVYDKCVQIFKPLHIYNIKETPDSVCKNDQLLKWHEIVMRLTEMMRSSRAIS